MGIQIWGAFGGFQKKAGALVGRWVNGQNVISAVPHPSDEPPSEAQLNYRAKFRLVVTWLSWISPIIKVGFQNAHEERQSAFNAAFVYNYKNAVSGTSAANFAIDYPEVLFSKGKLDGPRAGMVMWAPDETGLVFSWLPEVESRFNRSTDRACFVVYCAANGLAVTSLYAVKRADLGYLMALPPDFWGRQLHCYVCFASANGHDVSDSVYLGVSNSVYLNL